MTIRQLTGSIILVFLVAISAFAQISPGKLSKFHARFDGLTNCTKCHELGKAASPAKCLECHVSLKKQIEAGKGYHNSSEVRQNSCFKCHSEHNGLDFEVLYWKNGRDSFIHDSTGFRLEGAHARLECNNCHKQAFNSSVAGDNSLDRDRSFLGLSTACTNCHGDEHNGQLGNDCSKCHTQDNWKPPSRFNHATTRYPLTGKHQNVDCLKCHPAQPGTANIVEGLLVAKGSDASYLKYGGLQFASCQNCHQDIHRGKLGSECASCHQTGGFGKIIGTAFDHSKTDYPLMGKHRQVSCEKCHTSERKSAGLKFGACRDCHTDVHRGEFSSRVSGGACDDCHTVEGFQPSKFDLEKHQQGKFPLSGGHLATPCIACHKPLDPVEARFLQYKFATYACQTCHEDPHSGDAQKWMPTGTCESCHVTTSWRRITFDHNLTKFNLDGKHRTLTCAECHKVDATDNGKIHLKGLPTECSKCHAEPHQQQFARRTDGGVCTACHTPAGWKWLAFNHNLDARFKLEGAHSKVACTACHKTETGFDGKTFVRYNPIPFACIDCHKKS